MEKPLFSKLKKPMLLTSLSDNTVEDTICTIRNAICDGTDGFLLHMERITDAHNEENLKKIADMCADKPIYTMNYRWGTEKTDDELTQELLMSVKAGASMIDLMGDMFCQKDDNQLTFDKAALEKQRETIEKVHDLGGEVLMSSHVFRYMDTEELLSHTKELESRGCDFVKIAMQVNSKEQALDATKSTSIVSDALKIPFMHICMGKYGKLHRAIGPFFGSFAALCVQTYTPNGHKDKVLLRNEKKVFECIDTSFTRN